MPSFNPAFQLITPRVDEATENRILLDVSERLVKEMYEELEHTFREGFLAPGIRPSDERRLTNYLLKIAQAYPEDEQGRLTELSMMLDPDYVKAYKLGLVPPPLSHPWTVFIRVPWLFTKTQQDFRALYLRYARKTEGQPPTSSPITPRQEY